MKRIDFLGLPGSGKSTVYNEVIKILPKSFLTAEIAKKKAVCRFLKSSCIDLRIRAINTAKLLMVNSRLFSHIINVTKYVFAGQNDLLYSHFSRDNEDFIKACIDGFNTFDSQKANHARFFLSAKWFLQKTAEIQLMQEQLGVSEKVIFDESLSHKIFEVINFDLKPVTDLQWTCIEKIFWTIPLPYKAIYFEEDIRVIEKRLTEEPRLRQREILNSFKGSLIRWIEDARLLTEIGKDIMKKRNVDLLELPKDIEPNKKAAMIKTFLVN